ncbi:glycoside hydrolase family 16 protein [Plenodomus tracheiphilus IPT5]|uniref:chitinase n=1 Tax=Plenodomus tracheiphilus IPT5 TaxID=1408161 RepID=A0A6A7AVR6_9PLEO|nr:glycoside hydrolase family 16 protein [Plenodomus tracheiphilus IPT5]
MRYTSYAAASALAAIASAQTFTDCNPMEKTCPNNPAMPKNWNTDFTAGKDAIKGWKQTAGSLTYGPEGAEFIVAKKGDAPTIGSSTFLHYGYVEVVMKAAPGVGIVSSIVLQSDNLDEVDWEWIGGVDSRVQQNYFGKGNTTTYDRMIEAPVANNQNDFHSYALNWTAESLTWIVDGKPTRTLNKADANGGKNYPQTPCNVRLGNWPGGDSENEGTRQWAGGNVPYDRAPFKMTVKSIKVINYSPGTEYKWTDKTGNSDSIQVIGAGNTEGAPQNTAVIEASASATLAPLESGVDAPKTTAPAGAAPSGSPDSAKTPCNCGTATTTVTGAPPPATNAPPAIFTTEYPAVSMSTTITSAQVPVASPPPYPSSGLDVDTRSAPPAVNPTAPTGALPVVSPRPSGNATSSAATPEFTGAAAHNKASLLVGVVAECFCTSGARLITWRWKNS